MRKILVMAAVIFSTPASAVGQGGWVYIVPSVDEAKVEVLTESSKSVTEKRIAVPRFVRTQAPLAEWIQEAAFDSARACEDFRLQYETATIEGGMRVARHLTMREWARERVEKLGPKALDGELEPDLRKLVRDEIQRQEQDRERGELLRKLPEDARQKVRDQFEQMQRLADRPFVDSAVRAKQLGAGRCVPTSAVYPGR